MQTKTSDRNYTLSVHVYNLYRYTLVVSDDVTHLGYVLLVNIVALKDSIVATFFDAHDTFLLKRSLLVVTLFLPHIKSSPWLLMAACVCTLAWTLWTLTSGLKSLRPNRVFGICVGTL